MTKRLRPDQFPPWYNGQSINEKTLPTLIQPSVSFENGRKWTQISDSFENGRIFAQ